MHDIHILYHRVDTLAADVLLLDSVFVSFFDWNGNNQQAKQLELYGTDCRKLFLPQWSTVLQSTVHGDRCHQCTNWRHIQWHRHGQRDIVPKTRRTSAENVLFTKQVSLRRVRVVVDVVWLCVCSDSRHAYIIHEPYFIIQGTHIWKSTVLITFHHIFIHFTIFDYTKEYICVFSR